MKLNELALYLEGGKAIGEVSRISKSDIEPTLKEIKSQVLDKLGIKKFGPIGSVGKKESSGDLDIAVEVPEGMEVKDIHRKIVDLGFEKSKGNSPTLLSFKFPIYNASGKTEEFAQVDFMFGKKSWLEFGYWAPSEDESKYSGMHRNILLASIIRYSRELAGKEGKTWAIDFNKGISRKTRGIIKMKSGKEREGVIAKTLITDSPDKLVKLLNIATDGNWKVSDFTQSFESLWTKTKEVFSPEVLEKIKNYVQSGTESSKKEVPTMESILARMKNEILLEEQEVKLKPDTIEMIDILKKNSDYTDDDIRVMTGYTIRILIDGVSDEDRRAAIRELEEIPEFEFEFAGSSVGRIVYKKAKINVKHRSMQGTGSAGKKNESEFDRLINEYSSKENPITVVFKTSDRELKVENVTGATGVGDKTSKYKKTDTVLSTTTTDFNISIKQGNAASWESADTAFKEAVYNLIDEIKSGSHKKLKFKPLEVDGRIHPYALIMTDKKTDKKVSGLIKRVDDEELVEKMVFGGVEVDSVIVGTFKESDFILGDKGEIIVKVKAIINTLADLDKYKSWPWMRIRHATDRRKTSGLRPIVQTEKSLYRKDGKTIQGSMIKLD